MSNLRKRAAGELATSETKTEIVKQVKLTPNQKITLIQAANNGGVFDHNPTWNVIQPLVFLRLVEKRPKYTGRRLAELEAKIAALWKQLPAIVKARDYKALEKVSSDIRSWEYDKERTAYYLTDSAKEYLTLGKVLITTALPDATGTNSVRSAPNH